VMPGGRCGSLEHYARGWYPALHKGGRRLRNAAFSGREIPQDVSRLTGARLETPKKSRKIISQITPENRFSLA
jgi:hypothetical protein